MRSLLINRKVANQAWALLDTRGKKQIAAIGILVAATAGLEVMMVGSVLPFLAVLSDPNVIQEQSLLKWAYDIFGFTSEYDFTFAFGVAGICTILATTAVQLLRTYAIVRFSAMRQHSLSAKLLTKYLAQPYVFYLDRNTGDMSKNILEEAGRVANDFFLPALQLVASFVTIFSLVTLLVLVNPLVAIAAFFSFAGVYGFTFWISRTFIRRLGKERAHANSERFRFANEALGGIKDIKILGQEYYYIDRFRAPSLRIAKGTAAMRTVSDFPGQLIRAAMFSGVFVFCLILLDRFSLQSGMPLDGLLPIVGIFAFASQRLLPALSITYASLTALQYGAAAVETVYSDLHHGVRAFVGLGETQPRLGFEKHLSFKDVSYTYPSSSTAGLRDVTFEIRKGQKIGIVGSTGAGKTTLADITLGLLRPGSGKLCVDEEEITDENLRSWQRCVGYVPQNIFLADASIFENIALGITSDKIDLKQAQLCARWANLDDFIENELPNGYTTQVGERGVRLSGGQRQRIGIARALYHEAELLILDEATSALDGATENEVMSAINSLPGDRTIIIIAHRLSTLRNTDRILVLDRGRVAAFGKWENLEKSNAIFQALKRESLVA